VSLQFFAGAEIQMELVRVQNPSNTLIQSLQGLITPDVVSRASSFFGESQAAVTKGLGVALWAILGSLASKANDTSLMNQAFSFVKDRANDGSILNNAAILLGPVDSNITSLGQRFTSMLFVGKTNAIVSALSSFSGIKPSTASGMLVMASSLVLGVLGKFVRKHGFNAADLSNLLIGQRSTISALLPAGFLNVPKARTKSAQAVGTTRAASPSGTARWMVLFVLGLLALWALYSWFGNRPRVSRDQLRNVGEVLPDAGAHLVAAYDWEKRGDVYIQSVTFSGMRFVC
jgi:hypothetical protein